MPFLKLSFKHEIIKQVFISIVISSHSHGSYFIKSLIGLRVFKKKVFIKILKWIP